MRFQRASLLCALAAHTVVGMTAWSGLFLRDAILYVSLASVCLLAVVLYSPRLLLNDYPPAIRAMVPAKTTAERRASIVIGLPFLLVLFGFPIYAAFAIRSAQHAGFFAVWAYVSGIVFAFNVWDWLAIDWLLFCAITPTWVVIPGTEGHPAYQDYFFHFTGFLKGTVFSGAFGLIAATVVALLVRV